MKKTRADLIRETWGSVKDRYPAPELWRGHTLTVPILPDEATVFRPGDIFSLTNPPPLKTLSFQRDGFKYGDVQYNVVHCEGLIVWSQPDFDDA